tara:strand:- start:283 stop:1080 length:798 start_codon:yes stop_codon:yes gene_type:complete
MSKSPASSEAQRSNDSRHFEDGGNAYARHRPTYPEQLAEALAAECMDAFHALDVGCGSGQLSVLLANHFNLVTATDPSEEQIANAEAQDNVRYLTEPAERISLADNSVDLIVAAQAAHWFDLDRFYAEARRVGTPSAMLALVSYGVPTVDGEPAERFDSFYWQDIHRFWPEERTHVEKGYRTLHFPFEEAALPPLFIERHWNFAELEGYVRTWSAVKRAIRAGEADLVQQGLADISATWGPPDHKRLVKWPIAARIGAVSSFDRF